MTFDDLHIHVLPWAPGCPSSMATTQLRNAAREWCQDTEVWTDTLAPVVTEAGREVYALNLEPHQDVARLISVTVGGKEFQVLQASAAKARLRRDPTSTDPFCWTTNTNDLHLYPAPAGGAQILVECSLMPSAEADEVADEAVGQYREIVAAGALARLLSMLKEEWSNPNEATRFSGIFIGAKKGAKRSAADGFSRPNLRVTPA